VPVVQLNGININYDATGAGPLVVLVMGTGSPGRVWKAHQVPAPVGAGYRVVNFDNRGIAPSSECAEAMRRGPYAFAEYIDVSPKTVLCWEDGSTQRIRAASQELLDQALKRAGPDVHARFDRVLTDPSTQGYGVVGCGCPDLRKHSGRHDMSGSWAGTGSSETMKVSYA